MWRSVLNVYGTGTLKTLADHSKRVIHIYIVTQSQALSASKVGLRIRFKKLKYIYFFFGEQMSGEQKSGEQKSGEQLSGEQFAGGQLSGGQLSVFCIRWWANVQWANV